MEASSEPFFVVIAGPNGAGKSTTSDNFIKRLGIPESAFDWDDRFNKAWARFSYDPLVFEGVRNSVNQEFREFIESGLSDRKSIAYETNFHHEYNLDLHTRAKASGFTTLLFFLYLESSAIASERVQMRVEKGGHDVSEKDIRERYSGGLEMLNDAITAFDKTYIYNTSELYESKLLLFHDRSIPTTKVYLTLPQGLLDRVPNLDELNK